MGNFDYNIRTQTYPKPYKYYANVDITVSGNTTNYSVKDETPLFDSINYANAIWLRISGGEVGIKFNDNSNDSISFSSGESLVMQGLTINDVILTTPTASGTTAKIFIFGWR